MSIGSLGRRWARAFLLVAIEQRKIDAYLNELALFDQALRCSRELKIFMTDQAFEAHERKAALEKLVQPLGLSLSTQHFLSLLIDRERMAFFSDIFLSFRDQADEALNRVRVQVKVQSALEESSQVHLRSVLEKMTEKNVILQIAVDPSILGGIVIRIADQVFDGSVKTTLVHMQEKMRHAVIL